MKAALVVAMLVLAIVGAVVMIALAAPDLHVFRHLLPFRFFRFLRRSA